MNRVQDHDLLDKNPSEYTPNMMIPKDLFIKKIYEPIINSHIRLTGNCKALWYLIIEVYDYKTGVVMLGEMARDSIGCSKPTFYKVINELLNAKLIFRASGTHNKYFVNLSYTPYDLSGSVKPILVEMLMKPRCAEFFKYKNDLSLYLTFTQEQRDKFSIEYKIRDGGKLIVRKGSYYPTEDIYYDREKRIKHKNGLQHMVIIFNEINRQEARESVKRNMR
jgi:hypothetical protein